MMKYRFVRPILGIAKVSVAALIIILIAGALGVLNKDGQVPDADADIYDFFGSSRNTSQAFGKALKNQGHAKPQVYELNGNTVYFSSKQVRQPPAQVLEDYQREFVRVGMNNQAYTRMNSHEDEARFLAGMNGAVVPHVITPDYITMGGMKTRGKVGTTNELIKEHFKRGKNEETMFKGHYWMEIFKEVNSPFTTVLASWSDDNFSYSAMIPGASKYGEFDPVIPSCPGCVRINKFSEVSQGSASRHQTNIFETTHSPEQMRAFYEHAMGTRGWQLEEDVGTLDALRQSIHFDGNQMQVVRFNNRDDEMLTIMIYPSGMQQTTIHTELSKRD